LIITRNNHSLKFYLFNFYTQPDNGLNISRDM